jgi:NTE family protein
MEIGLALSGGGVRAAVFHLGVLRRLADETLLESISQLSTVSGGSLIIAALMTKANMKWPSSSAYQKEVYPALRQLLTETDLLRLRAVGWMGLVKFNAQLISNRAHVLSRLLLQRWGVVGTLRHLPDRPVWWINTTCLETGKNWRFSKREMGDWQFGRHYEPDVLLADAAAASAAVPYAIGALGLNLPQQGWYRTDPATRQPLERQPPQKARVRLWDGGAYENLGLETLFKPRGGLIDCDFLICGDASGPLLFDKTSSPLSLLRGHLVAPRLFDVTSDQIRSLRSRMFVGAIEDNKIKGALLRMGNSVRDIDLKADRQRPQMAYDQFQSDQEVTSALRYPTDLKALPKPLFDQIARHGYEVADATLTAYSPDEFPRSLDWV